MHFERQINFFSQKTWKSSRLHQYGQVFLNTGCHGQGKKSGKWNFFQVREKSGNFDMSQGNLEKMQKDREKSGNFKFLLKWYGYGSLLKSKD